MGLLVDASVAVHNIPPVVEGSTVEEMDPGHILHEGCASGLLDGNE